MVFVQNGLQRYKLFSKKQCHQLKLFESEEKRAYLIVWLKPIFSIYLLKNGINANPIHYKSNSCPFFIPTGEI